MNKHLKNASYLARHKWFVFLAGLQTKAPIWRLIIHDWSKLTPLEWNAYATYFYTVTKGSRVVFDLAWLSHIHRNPHHWQYWVLREDDGATIYLDMPEHFIREMVADWMGAGRAITGRWEVNEWYAKNREKIRISDKTRTRVEDILDSVSI